MAVVNDYKFNPGVLIMTAAFAIVYIMVDRLTGLAFTSWTIPGCWFCWTFTNASDDVLAYTGYTAMQWAVAVNLFGWIAQFIGHGCFEKRAPALVTNLVYSLLAPFFQMFEVLNYFGYKEGAELDAIMAKIDADIVQFHAAKKTAKTS